MIIIYISYKSINAQLDRSSHRTMQCISKWLQTEDFSNCANPGKVHLEHIRQYPRVKGQKIYRTPVVLTYLCPVEMGDVTEHEEGDIIE